MRYLAAAAVVLALTSPAIAQQGLGGALDRQDQQRLFLQSDIRRETDIRRQDLQRQLDQGRIQQQIERQLELRQAPVACPFSRPQTGC
jgi:hypothetical protein